MDARAVSRCGWRWGGEGGSGVWFVRVEEIGFFLIVEQTARIQYAVSFRPVVVVLLMALGLIFGNALAGAGFWWVVGLTVVLLGVWLVVRRWHRRWWSVYFSALVLGLAGVGMAASWWAVRYERLAEDDIGRMVQAEPSLWRLRGTVSTTPRVRVGGRGSLARFAYRGPLTYCRVVVDGVVLNDGTFEAVSGKVLLRIEASDRRFRVGDRIEMYGLLRSFAAAHNPGEFDQARLAKFEGLAGVLTAKTRGNVEFSVPVAGAEAARSATSWGWRFQAWRAGVQARALGWLQAGLPESGGLVVEREALLSALLLGERGPELDDLQKSFRRIGLAHLLSISGLHLAILVLTGLLFLRFVNPPLWLERLATCGLVLFFLLIVPARIPVWRAGIMVLGFTAAGWTGRKITALNILAWTALVLLIWQPREVFSVGFQLSFGVVFVLLTLTNPLRYALFGEPHDIEMLSSGEMFREWFKSFVAATLVAWLLSMPLVAFHFQRVPLVAPLATLLASPLVLVILVAGYVKVLTASIFPSLGVLLGPVLTFSAEWLIHLIGWLEGLPFANVLVKPPSVWWTVVTTVSLFVGIRWLGMPAFDDQEAGISKRHWDRRGQIIMVGRLRISSRVLFGTFFLVLLVWLVQPPLWPSKWRGADRVAVRITMLSVGSGSCYVLESGTGEVYLFDAGAGGFFGAGDAIILPALRELGITKVPTLIISHGNLDHYTGALEVMETLGTERLLISGQMRVLGRRKPWGAVAFLLAEAEKLGVEIVEVGRGTSWEWGAGDERVRLEVLQPMVGFEYKKSNDTSMVLRLETQAGVRALFTGDLQAEAIGQLRRDFTAAELRAEILELPHHGGWLPEAVELVTVVDPAVVLQSAGRARVQHDRWGEVLAERARYVTAWVGAVTCTIYVNGQIEVTTFLAPDEVD